MKIKFVKLSILIIVFTTLSCKKAEDVLNSKNFYEFYIDYKKNLLKKRKPKRVNLDSLLSLHKITKKDLDIVKKGVRKNPNIWYHFSMNSLSILDSSISFKDSIAKIKRDSIRATMFRYKYPDRWRVSRDLYIKNKRLQKESRKKRNLENKKKKKNKIKRKNKIYKPKRL